MIAFIKGRVAWKEENAVIIELHGIGYRIFVSTPLLETLVVGTDVHLMTYHHVREEQFDLYGFAQRRELDFFQTLLRVSGVGTRVALSIISQLPIEKIQHAIIHGETAVLQNISGIGRKTAERIIVELKESLALLVSSTAEPTKQSSQEMSVVDALLALGYSRAEALSAMRGVDHTLSLQEQVRAALKQMRQ